MGRWCRETVCRLHRIIVSIALDCLALCASTGDEAVDTEDSDTADPLLQDSGSSGQHLCHSLLYAVFQVFTLSDAESDSSLAADLTHSLLRSSVTALVSSMPSIMNQSHRGLPQASTGAVVPTASSADAAHRQVVMACSFFVAPDVALRFDPTPQQSQTVEPPLRHEAEVEREEKLLLPMRGEDVGEATHLVELCLSVLLRHSDTGSGSSAAFASAASSTCFLHLLCAEAAEQLPPGAITRHLAAHGATPTAPSVSLHGALVSFFLMRFDTPTSLGSPPAISLESTAAAQYNAGCLLQLLWTSPALTDALLLWLEDSSATAFLFPASSTPGIGGPTSSSCTAEGSDQQQRRASMQGGMTRVLAALLPEVWRRLSTTPGELYQEGDTMGSHQNRTSTALDPWMGQQTKLAVGLVEAVVRQLSAVSAVAPMPAPLYEPLRLLGDEEVEVPQQKEYRASDSSASLWAYSPLTHTLLHRSVGVLEMIATHLLRGRQRRLHRLPHHEEEGEDGSAAVALSLLSSFLGSATLLYHQHQQQEEEEDRSHRASYDGLRFVCLIAEVLSAFAAAGSGEDLEPSGHGSSTHAAWVRCMEDACDYLVLVKEGTIARETQGRHSRGRADEGSSNDDVSSMVTTILNDLALHLLTTTTTITDDCDDDHLSQQQQNIMPTEKQERKRARHGGENHPDQQPFPFSLSPVQLRFVLRFLRRTCVVMNEKFIHSSDEWLRTSSSSHHYRLHRIICHAVCQSMELRREEEAWWLHRLYTLRPAIIPSGEWVETVDEEGDEPKSRSPAAPGTTTSTPARSRPSLSSLRMVTMMTGPVAPAAFLSYTLRWLPHAPSEALYRSHSNAQESDYESSRDEGDAAITQAGQEPLLSSSSVWWWRELPPQLAGAVPAVCCLLIRAACNEDDGDEVDGDRYSCDAGPHELCQSGGAVDQLLRALSQLLLQPTGPPSYPNRTWLRVRSAAAAARDALLVCVLQWASRGALRLFPVECTALWQQEGYEGPASLSDLLRSLASATSLASSASSWEEWEVAGSGHLMCAALHCRLSLSYPTSPIRPTTASSAVCRSGLQSTLHYLSLLAAMEGGDPSSSFRQPYQDDDDDDGGDDEGTTPMTRAVRYAFHALLCWVSMGVTLCNSSSSSSERLQLLVHILEEKDDPYHHGGSAALIDAAAGLACDGLLSRFVLSDYHSSLALWVRHAAPLPSSPPGTATATTTSDLWCALCQLSTVSSLGWCCTWPQSSLSVATLLLEATPSSTPPCSIQNAGLELMHHVAIHTLQLPDGAASFTSAMRSVLHHLVDLLNTAYHTHGADEDEGPLHEATSEEQHEDGRGAAWRADTAVHQVSGLICRITNTLLQNIPHTTLQQQQHDGDGAAAAHMLSCARWEAVAGWAVDAQLMRWWWSKVEEEGEDIDDGGAQAASARLVPLVLILQQSRLCMMAMRAGGGLGTGAPSMSDGDQSRPDCGPGVGDDVSPLLRGLHYTGCAVRPSLLHPQCSHHRLCPMASTTAPPSFLLALPYFPTSSNSSSAPLASADVRCQCDWLRCTTWCIRTFLSTAISSSTTVASQTTTVSSNTRAVVDLLQLLSMLLRDCPSTPLPADMYALLRTAVHAAPSAKTMTTCLMPNGDKARSDEVSALCCLIDSHLLPLHSPRRSAPLLHHPTMLNATGCQSIVLPPSSPCACISKVNMWPALIHSFTAPYDVIWLPALHRSFPVLLLSPATGYHDYQCCCCCELGPSAMTTALLCLNLVDPPYLYLNSSRGASHHPNSRRWECSSLSPSFTLSAKERLAVSQNFFDITLHHLLRYLPPATTTTRDCYNRSVRWAQQREVEGDDEAERSPPLDTCRLPSRSEDINSRKRARLETRDTTTITMLAWFCVWARRLSLLSHQLAPLPLPRRTALASLLLRLQHLGDTPPRSGERAAASGVVEQTIDQHSNGASLLPQLLQVMTRAAYKWVQCVVCGNTEPAPRER